jgi:hypothetical protein
MGWTLCHRDTLRTHVSEARQRAPAGHQVWILGYDRSFITVEQRTNMRRFALCCLAALVLLVGCKKDVSGTYLLYDQGAVCWLQLVRTPDNHVTGQLIASILKTDGEIERRSVALTGAVDGENVSLTGGGFLGLSTTTFSGTFEGDSLTLTGVQSAPITLKRASLADYQAQVAQQNSRAQALLGAKADAEAKAEALRADANSKAQALQAERNFTAEIDGLVTKMQQFDADADVHLGKFPNAETHYEAITAKIADYVARENRLAGNPDRAVDRSQLDVAATQESLTTDQMHYEAQSLQSSLKQNIAPLVSQDMVMEQKCTQTGSLTSDLTATEIDGRQVACRRLLSAGPLFRDKYSAMSAGLRNLEDVYTREKQAQGSLLATAQKLE